MNAIQVLACLTTGTGFLISALAIPLILRRVRPNGIYGVRTKASFASTSDWYRINAMGGRYLVVSGIVITLSGVIGFFLPLSMFDTYSISAAVITLLAVFVPCLRLCSLKPANEVRNESAEVRATGKS